MLALELNSQFFKDFWPVILIGGLAAVLLFKNSRRKRRGESVVMSDAEAQRRIPSLKEHLNVRADLEKLIIDLQDLSRQINAHIDTRFCKLEVLMREADAKIRKLEALNAGKASNSRSGVEEIDPEKSLVYKLADAGKTSVEIAREMNKNTGEIELILSLRRSTSGSNGIDYRVDD